MGLTKYLVSELLQSAGDKVGHALRSSCPRRRRKDWELITAGQRVQVIRRKGEGGVLEFGTAVDHRRATARSPVCSVLRPVPRPVFTAMIDVLQRCFGDKYAEWKPKLKQMMPSLGVKLSENEALFREVWDWTSKTLRLDGVEKNTPHDAGVASNL